MLIDGAGPTAGSGPAAVVEIAGGGVGYGAGAEAIVGLLEHQVLFMSSGLNEEIPD